MNSKANSDPRALGQRKKIRRNRKVTWPANSMTTDGYGNVTARPLTKQLPCFGDPVEWLMGRSDQPRQWGDKKPEPHGCAGCPVHAYCNTVAWERINSSPELIDAHDAWERRNYHLDAVDRYRTAEWAGVVEAINRYNWTDCNDAALVADREQREAEQLEKRRKRSRHKPKPPRPRKISAALHQAIQVYRDKRAEELTDLKEQANPPLFIRNRRPERVILIADAWQARETLERENKPSSGRAVFEWLVEHGKIAADAPKSMVKRVEEALVRVATLLDDDWPYFDPHGDLQPRKPGLHDSVVWKIIE